MNLKSIFSLRSFNIALPWLTTLFGLAFFLAGTFIEFTKPEVKEIFSGLGKTLLASGIFAFILKSQQLLGVYKDELTKVIFEPKFLQNRKDLADFWEKTTLELFKHKFPGINKKITKDVKDLYLPTQSVQYYDNLKMYINVKVIDVEKELIEVIQTSKFTIIPCDREPFLHSFVNNIHTGGHNDDYLYELQKFKV
ncbi:MAG: hypothetical protein MUF43_13100, partial [Flavobacterium sp.]|nr:hypothetical protein [Flavobacterium sp.]